MQKKISIDVFWNDEYDFEMRQLSDKHWGEEVHSSEELGLEFFDKAEFKVLAFDQDTQTLVGGVYCNIRYVDDEKWGFIGGVIVHTEYRHQGIATKMLEYSKQEFMKQACKYILLATDIPRLGVLYSNVGFEKLDCGYTFYDKKGGIRNGEGGMIFAFEHEMLNKIQTQKSPINIGPSDV